MQVKDYIEKIIDNRGKTPSLVDIGQPLIEAQCFSSKNYIYKNDAIKHISQTTYDNMRSGNCYINDILVTLVGNNFGKMAIVKEEVAIAQNIIGLRVNNLANPIFLFYIMQSKWFQSLFKSLNRSSSQPSVNINDLINIQIDLPPRPVQDKVANILTEIDNQIERNNNIVKTLQVLGQTIYSVNVNKTITKKLKDVSIINTGKEDANHSTKDGLYKFFTCSEGSFLCNDWKFEGKNILVAGNGNFNVKFYDGKFNAYQRIYVIKNDKIFGNLYYTLYFNTNLFKVKSNGSIIKFITIDMLNNINVPQFSNDINNALNKIITEISNITNNNDELQTLKSRLLPLLINGQLQ